MGTDLDHRLGGSAATWMQRLLRHYHDLHTRYPDDRLVVVFDIDGTIIDTRHLIHHTLLEYDRCTGTEYFRLLEIDDITVHEAEVDALLHQLGIPDALRPGIAAFYANTIWSCESLLAAHRPYQGVLEVIRWFQLQPRTFVALNTGRPESIRGATLQALNQLGREYRVSFPKDLLFMKPGAWGDGVVQAKVDALTKLQSAGYRVAAVVDNEPENLGAMAEADRTGEVLFLHANTIFLSARRPMPRCVVGHRYDLTPFAEDTSLRGHVELVCNSAGDDREIEAFFYRAVRWVSVPVRLDPYGRADIDAPEGRARPEPDVDLCALLRRATRARRAVRLDLQHGDRRTAEAVLSLLEQPGVSTDGLWFSGDFAHLGEAGIRLLRSWSADVTISCAVDFLTPLVFGALEHALDIIQVMREWGVDRFGIRWGAPRVRELIAELERWGCEVDVYGVTDAESLLQSTLLLPRSVTAGPNAFHVS